MNERRQKLNRPRPVPYPNFEMRNMARDLKEMLPPEASEAMVMRVLKLCHGDRGLAAEHLLTHMSTLMGATAQTAALEAADIELPPVDPPADDPAQTKVDDYMEG